MMQKLYARCAAWATQWKAKAARDPFRYARFETAAIYSLVGFVVIVVMDYFVDSSIRNSMYDVVINQTGEPVREAILRIELLTWLSRLSRLAIYAVSVYVITGFSMRHIKRMAELQRRFIATASHELRTPLAIMKNAQEVALRHKSTLAREKAIGVLEANLEEVNRLSSMVQFLIDFSKTERQSRALALVPIDLTAAVSQRLLLFKDSAQESGVTLSFSADAPHRVLGNVTALEEIVVNLIKNALANTPRGGSIAVEVSAAAGRVVVSVRDTGGGIAAKNLPYIFEPFYRGDTKDRATKEAGMGLGLSIVREFVQLMGGMIRVESRQGAGSTFFIEFPELQS